MKLKNKFIVIIPLFNVKDLIEQCLMSILTQNFEDVGIIIRDDMSTDGTDKVVKKIFKNDLNNFQTKMMGKDVIYIRNKEKFYPIGNTYDSVINYVDNEDAIISVVDGDDMLTKSDAISKVYNVYYNNPNIWLVWSQHRCSNGNIGQSKSLPNDNTIYTTRNYWSVTHFRTSKIGLYKKINKIDLKDPFTDEEYSSFAGDAALLYPFIEMCGNENSYFLNEILYHYNNDLPFNEHNKNLKNAVKYGTYFKEKGKRYSKIKNL